MEDSRWREQTVKDMVRKAASLYRAHAESLLHHPEICILLGRYERAVQGTSRRMRESGVAKACTVCATRGPGSCCFPGIEEGYDEVLLLINLLLGCSLPGDREIPDSCFFVGQNGCKLLARYYFCLHYLCPELQRELGADAVRALLSTVGEELHAGWQLEQRLRNWLKCSEIVD